MRPRPTGPSFARYLSPGHEENPAAWKPADLPLAEPEARSFLSGLKSLKLHDLESMRLMARRDRLAEQIANQDESRDLALFAGAAPPRDGFSEARELAQKLLLWRWHWEECQEEIALLEAACAESERLLPGHFRESPNPERQRADAPDRGADLTWQTVTANAAFFIPCDTAILAEGDMALELAERLDFKPCGKGRENLASAQAPLWRALGHTRPASGSAARIYNPARAWLVWRSA